MICYYSLTMANFEENLTNESSHNTINWIILYRLYE